MANAIEIKWRQCGDCHACCIAMTIAELDKKAGVPCPNLDGAGCGIYPDRPPVCSGFACLYLRAADFVHEIIRDDDRPDKCGLILVPSNEAVMAKLDAFVIHAHETEDGSSKTYHAEKLLRRLQRRAVVVIITNERTRRVLGPRGAAERYMAEGRKRAPELRFYYEGVN